MALRQTPKLPLGGDLEKMSKNFQKNHQDIAMQMVIDDVEIQSENDKKGIGLEDIYTEAEKLLNRGNEAKESKGLFTVKTATRWIEQAKTRPIPKMLFGEFWFEGELCILFADTNLGKSILAVQIGNSISRGEQIQGFKLETPKQPILYFDFELSDKQFENRYSIKFEQHYNFDNNLIRVEINPDAVIPETQTFEDFLNHSLERSITETGAKVLIIDNITYLKNETERAKDALPLMKHLKALKSKYGLSVLVLAHTPKRDNSRPISVNDIQGSKMISIFMDSCFAIGESHKDKSLRYLKQIKARQNEKVFDTENVCICQIAKPTNFLKFEFLDYGTEREHLREITEQDKGKKIIEAMELKKQGASNIEIARRFGVSEGAIRKWIKKANENEAGN
ncbi:Helix-turn-helix domain-containing protein [Aquiflexum balticum DSM 16537]|uniref:Helix-turn-helix domain-containing protein n=1 Tax=Aquiflexum balticum DSM 16537 TaxID=758820 RepID=A0A1W2HC41_9BACT|nr:AAA family ATPase [Aquiflexum balticum]SMD46394.1 Helix-turn-helix domain-containing protein [Aquiflexum balticum DSM 16537]